MMTPYQFNSQIKEMNALKSDVKNIQELHHKHELNVFNVSEITGRPYLANCLRYFWIQKAKKQERQKKNK